jgi:hypothetical protein
VDPDRATEIARRPPFTITVKIIFTMPMPDNPNTHGAIEPFVPRFNENRSNNQRNRTPKGWIRAICVLLGSTTFLAFNGSSRAAEATPSPSPEVTAGSDADAKLSLKGKTIGITVIGTDHYWDLRCYQAQIDEVKRLGGASIRLGCRPRRQSAN